MNKNMKNKAIIIYCYETKEKFNSINEASIIFKVGAKSINNVLDKSNRTCKGYHWCTDLSIFDGVELTKGNETSEQEIYCYETKEKFEDINEALKFIKLNSIEALSKCIDNPNRSAGGYHWCTSLDIFNGKELTKSSSKTKSVYCYETKEKFENIAAAAKHINKAFNSISQCLDNPNKSSGGFHWCTDLSIFDGIELCVASKTVGTKIEIYCYETKIKYKSMKDAIEQTGITGISKHVLNDPKKVIGGFHWCTDLAIFNGVELEDNRKLAIKIYCYETKIEYTNIKQAVNETGITGIYQVVNKHDKTAGGFHWCTDLSIFDGVVLTSKDDITTNIYCYETKIKYKSFNVAEEETGISGIYHVIDNPNRSAGGYHWCTDLSIFDGIELSKGNDLLKQEIYCYETKEKFESIRSARLSTGLNYIKDIINNPMMTAGGFHWCTSLDIFDGKELSKSDDIKKIVYCYETKEKFESIASASKFYNLLSSSSIINILDDPNRTSGGYHWCSDLSIFDGVELIYPNTGVSGLEKEVVDYIKLIYNKDIIENSKSIIAPYEIDIYLPELNLAFEFNGNYWHSEQQGKDSNYHVNKTNLCKSKGIQLIHIYEYQWKTNKEVWLSFIVNKLKRNTNKIYARKCEVRLVSNEISKEFCDNNHLQGSVNSLINLGLYHNDELISLMTFSKPRFNKDYEWELIRFCNKSFTNVIGGASKLLKYFEVNFKPKSLLSYAEIDYSDGNLYSSLDFKLAVTNKPNYIWIKQDVVLPRYQTMKHKLNDLLSNFDSNLTETENMENNGYDKIWKCGTYVFVKNYV